MTTNSSDLNIELRSANGASAEFYQSDEKKAAEALRLLTAPQLFAQRHLVLGSKQGACMIPCKGIDMILARTQARSPLKFPLKLPLGAFDLVERSEAERGEDFARAEEPQKQERGEPQRRSAHVEVKTLGGWTVTLEARAVIRGNVQDERQLFSHLPEVPVIPFRLPEGGFGLINTANIICASLWPTPEALPGVTVPVEFCRWTKTPSGVRSLHPQPNHSWAVS